MDTMKAEKLKPMKSSTTQFPYNHILVHSVIALACSTSLLCLFPSQGAFIKHFLFTTIPSFWYSFANPKCLFIVVNVIVGFLIFGEYSKSSSSSSSSSGDEMYEEYVKRKMELNLREKSVVVVDNKPQQLEESNIVEAEDLEVEETFEDVKEEEEEGGGGGGGGVVVVDDGDDKEKGRERERDDDSEEQHGLPTEELNRRVEAFIARVNKQRWLEAKSLVCCKA
ncbi:hypothetical protein HS088_TW06G00584 [Tripterygium wilfordii]|uniref:DUF4408 domain-containing protein n=1 Tax=Tripterygium wilfordii TaxID=458696 RepID=A0A7J7DJC3_TRIWF|nr:hypothetical protein HS088_TW06G00584 [Tripterygium wilfordii]